MIESLKDLKQLFKLCRAQGITDFEMNGLKIKFGDLPQTQSQLDEIDLEQTNSLSGFPQGELTPEQLAFYSAGGIPKDDPYLNESMTG